MADSKISNLTAHTDIIDADSMPIVDSTAGATKKTLWSTIKSVLKTYFDTLYPPSTIASPALDDTLRYNGTTWVNSPGTSGAGAQGINFYMDDTTIIGTGANNDFPIKTLSKTPTGGAEDADTVTAVSGTNGLYGMYLYNTALGRTSLDAGVWVFRTYASVNATTGVTKLLRNVLRVRPGTGTLTITGSGTSRTATASSGTPFALVAIDPSAVNSDASWLSTPLGLFQITARTSDTEVTITTPSGYSNESAVAYNVYKKLFQVATPEINNITPNYLLFNTESVQPAFTVETTDKLAEMVFGNTTSGTTRTITFTHNGTEHYSHFQTPLITMHNNLSGLQGGTAGEYYHMTSAQATVLGNTSGTNTGDQDLSGLVTKATYDANTILAANTDNTPAAVTIAEQKILGRATGGNITALDIDSDLSSVSANDDTIPSAKATKAMGDLKLPLAGGTMTGSIANPKLDHAIEPASDDSYTGDHTNDLVAGETIAQWDVVYLKSDGKWWKTDADAVATAGMVCLGIATEAKNADEAINVVLRGIVRNDGWTDWTVGSPLYLGLSAGTMVHSETWGEDDIIRLVGFALTVDCIYFNPSNDSISYKA